MRTLHATLLQIALLSALLLAPGCSKNKQLGKHLERAESFYVQGELEKAKIEYLNVIRFDRTNALSIARIGSILLDQGALLQAVPALARARELNPNDLGIRVHYARALMETGSPAKAREEVLAVLSHSPTNQEAILLLAFTSRGDKLSTEAQQILEQIKSRGDNAALQVALANLLFTRGDTAGAEAGVRRSLQMNPAFSAAHVALANILVSRTNFAEAEKSFRAGFENASPRSRDKLSLVDFLSRSGRNEEAKKIVETILAKTSDFLPARKILAQMALGGKKPEEALSIAEDILRLDSINFDAQILRSQALMALGKTAQAVETLEKVNKSYSPMASVKYQLGLAYLLDKRLPQASAFLDEAISMDPYHTEAVLLKAQLDLRSGNPARATAVLQPLASLRPDALNLQLVLAESLLGEGRNDDALRLYQKLLGKNPNNDRVYFTYGLALRQADKPREARTAFEKVRAISPNNLPALYQLVDMELLERNFPKALSLIEAQSPEERKSANSLVLEGRVHLAQKAYDKSEVALQKAIEADANLSTAYYLLASVYSASKKQEKAITQLEALIAKNSKEERAMVLLGLIYTERKEVAKAQRLYEALLAINPFFVPALNNIAVLYSEQPGQLAKAYEMAQKARNAAPEDPYVADTLGWILFQQRRYTDAFPLIRQSVLRLRGAEGYYHLGMVYYMLGQEPEARTSFQAALRSKETFLGRDDAVRRMKLIESGSAASLSELKELFKSHPDELPLQMKIADLLAAEGSKDQAAKTYEDLLAANPQFVPALRSLARLNTGPLGNRARAKELIAKASELAPQDPEVKATAGRIAYEEGEFAQSYNLLRESTTVLTNRPGAFHDMAWSAYALGRESEAQTLMQRAFSVDPKSSFATSAQWFLSLVSAYRDPKALAALEPRLEQLLKSDPTHVPGLIASAQIQLGKGQTKDASQTYERVLKVYPNFALAQRQLAILYADTPGQESRAVELGSKARETIQGDPDLLLALAKLSYRKKDFRGGLILLQEATARRPQDPEIAYYFGATHLELKDNAKARTSLEKALAGGLREPAAAEARRLLATLPAR